ncbi:aspartate aminotransferase family protein [Nocardioides zeae]|uniref:Aspartate aminotransferase family protein n=1 Tax=Nocardioides imazamoxiresistens TaxID=3231893 RepID=A0ABU3Q120_9ACTN|nr:aspartate aminotransferase family protein [Nocardioides zeae]MDT9595054.1 aspartate aminotransferase family protein [Nocardioides zeae]
MISAHRRLASPRATGSPTRRPVAALLDRSSVDDLVEQLDAARDVLAGAFARTTQPLSGISPEAAAAGVAAVDLDRPLDGVGDVLDEVRRVYLDHAVWFHHPRYQAHLNCPVALPAVLGDVIAVAVNSSLDTWDQSGPATHMERHLLAWTAGRLGLPASADGIFTTGGTQSNLHALLLARGEALAAGADPARLRIVTSSDAHFSSRKAAMVLGLGEDAVVETAVDAAGRMDVEDLDAVLARLRTEGLVPMAVVATAGTTDRGCIDPLSSVARACRRHEVWLHVDAAYGGGLVTSRRRRHLLTGVERADSVTVDFHKTFFQPVACSAVLVADRATLRHVTHHAAYLNPSSDVAEDIPNQVDKSLQTTRRFDALKLWTTLRTLGPDRVGELLDTVIDLAAEVRGDLVGDPDFRVVTEGDLSTVLFRFVESDVDDERLDAVNEQARRRLYATGLGAVARTRLGGRTWLKLTLLNPATTLADVQQVLDLVRGHARAALAHPDEEVA